MRVSTGKSYYKDLDDGNRLEITIYPNKWTTDVSMTFWENGVTYGICSDQLHLNYNKFLPIKLAEKVATYFVNKQSLTLAGVKIFEKTI
jgi:hypothetical protein